MRRLAFFLVLLTLAACASDDSAPPATPAADAPAAESPVAAPAAASDEAAERAVTVVYLGDSLTAGYGLAGGEAEAYPALIESRLAEEGITVRTVNAGVSGDTSSGGLGRLDWYLSRFTVDVLVLALGANDGLRGLPTETLRGNLETIVERTRAAHPHAEIVLLGMMTPPNMGGAYAAEFSNVFPTVAEATRAAFIPFMLEGVAGERALNQADGIHPTAEGQRRMAETIAPEVEAAVRRAVERR